MCAVTGEGDDHPGKRMGEEMGFMANISVHANSFSFQNDAWWLPFFFFVFGSGN